MQNIFWSFIGFFLGHSPLNQKIQLYYAFNFLFSIFFFFAELVLLHWQVVLWMYLGRARKKNYTLRNTFIMTKLTVFGLSFFHNMLPTLYSLHTCIYEFTKMRWRFLMIMFVHSYWCLLAYVSPAPPSKCLVLLPCGKLSFARGARQQYQKLSGWHSVLSALVKWVIFAHGLTIQNYSRST